MTTLCDGKTHLHELDRSSFLLRCRTLIGGLIKDTSGGKWQSENASTSVFLSECVLSITVSPSLLSLLLQAIKETAESVAVMAVTEAAQRQMDSRIGVSWC